mmetsp:Transcript_13978/g.30225  ORF Transcript_13978/g.30225 Transcript_13978/m.30225 type:complete len:488 (+) Transcript_13978:97-1560(+)|eukprot:CAMPEP_0202900046 /NCGR_PEP_ID=MMETSP1392-20130828/9544_1 /ASSEMBLY_ACC=CAM_ASM_000868 /TAXON_ID=225041 /ORGANISM="Chlamydomonas chlamydogama, Strain SAG 11-48b" /LENGTH=487 /DNA_ID=CAMNT_0049586361 /DNA_START=78 /DNA_END=1541 /DNA_ORIENTATION=+
MFGQQTMQQLQPLVRGMMTSSVASSAAPALAAKTSSGGGIASLFGFGNARVEVPLSEPLPGVTAPLKGIVPTVAPKLETSVLSTGTKVATINSISPVTTVYLAAPGGSAYETAATAGASKVLEAMAFKATNNRTTFRLTRELEKIGAVAYSKVGRDSVGFAVDTVNIHAPEAVEILLDSVLNARYTYWETRESLDVIKENLSKALAQPGTVLAEVLHRAAFDGSLGAPLLVDPSALDSFTSHTLREYALSILQPSKVVLAAVGADHATIKSLSEDLIANVHSSGAAAAPRPSTYVGGTVNVLGTSSLTHAALAFEAKGGISDSKAAAVAAVTKALLDDARAALPWTRKESDVFSSFASFSYLYKDTGLVGVTASGSSSSQLVDAICKKVESVAKGVSDVQLKQAKAVAIGNYKATLASSAGAVSVIAPQILATGKFDAAEFVQKVESLTASDVSSFLAKATKSSPTFVTYGSLANLPRHESIAKRFG